MVLVKRRWLDKEDAMRQADRFCKIRYIRYIRLYSVKIRLYSEVIDSFKSVNQKVYIRFYSVYSVYSVYSDVFDNILFYSSLYFVFFSKSHWLRWLPIFYLLDPQFHAHNIINLRQANFHLKAFWLPLSSSETISTWRASMWCPPQIRSFLGFQIGKARSITARRSHLKTKGNGGAASDDDVPNVLSKVHATESLFNLYHRVRVVHHTEPQKPAVGA